METKRSYLCPFKNWKNEHFSSSREAEIFLRVDTKPICGEHFV